MSLWGHLAGVVTVLCLAASVECLTVCVLFFHFFLIFMDPYGHISHPCAFLIFFLILCVWVCRYPVVKCVCVWVCRVCRYPMVKLRIRTLWFSGVCVCLCVCVCVRCASACCDSHVCMYTHTTHTHTHTHTHIHTSTRTHTYIYILCLYLCVDV
jgi:hypothetical protein